MDALTIFFLITLGVHVNSSAMEYLNSLTSNDKKGTVYILAEFANEEHNPFLVGDYMECPFFCISQLINISLIL
jgi:hypothetical protein